MGRRKSTRGHNDLLNDVTGFTKAGVTIGIGSAIVGGAGGNAAGLGTMAGMMPAVGTTIMAKHALKNVKKMNRR